MTSRNPFEVVTAAAEELADLLAAQAQDAPLEAKARLLERAGEIRAAVQLVRP